MINDWKRMTIAGLASIFDGKGVEKQGNRVKEYVTNG